MRGRPMMYGNVTVTKKCCKAIPGKWKITLQSLQPVKSVKTPQQLQQKQQKWWWKEGSGSCLMCCLPGEGATGREGRENILHWFGFDLQCPSSWADELWMGAVWKKKSSENSWRVRRRGLHLVATGPAPHFLVKELCWVCLISPFLLLSSLLMGIFVWCGFSGKQQVPPVVAESQIPRCPGLRPCTAELEGHYKHMKVYFIFFKRIKPKEYFFLNVCTIVRSQLDAFISLLSFYSVFTQWPFKNIWRLSIPLDTEW